MKYGFGIDLGGTTVKLACFDEKGKMRHKWEIPTNTAENGRYILPDIARAVKDYLEKNRISREQVIGLGIGVPGPVSRQGVVNRCVNLGWGVFNIHQKLYALTGFPVKAGNDANVAALGECWVGGGRGCENMVMATLGTGVGGGIVLDGKILYGAHGSGGEIGHLVLDRNESLPCGCGKYGCVEQYCSATGIVRLAVRHLNRSRKNSSLRKRDKLECRDVFEAAARGDQVAKEILEEVYDRLAEFLADVCNVVDPELVLIGGGVSRAGKPLLDGIARHMHKYLFHAIHPLTLALATLGNDAGTYGAFKLILDESKNFRAEDFPLPEDPTEPVTDSGNGQNGGVNKFNDTVIISDDEEGTLLEEDFLDDIPPLNVHLVRLRNKEIIPIKGTNFQIGSDFEYVDYHLDNRMTSGIHAKIICKNGIYCIKDMASRNHTYVDEQQIPALVEVPLSNGAVIRIGGERFEFKMY